MTSTYTPLFDDDLAGVAELLNQTTTTARSAPRVAPNPPPAARGGVV